MKIFTVKAMNMKTTNYQAFASWFPGGIALASLQFIFPDSITMLGVMQFICIALLLGLFLNTLGKTIEPLLFYFWGGKPSRKILMEKGDFPINFGEKAKVMDELSFQYQADLPKNKEKQLDALFNKAMSAVTASPNTRIFTFNVQYGMSRTMLVTTIGIYLAALPIYFDRWYFHVLSLIVIFLFNKRAKQSAYYFCREVLRVYLGGKLPGN